MTTQVRHPVGLSDVSKALQSLHQQLLTFQANDIGFRGSPLQLFDQATKNSAFDWLKPLREGIVALDERRADDAPISEAETKAIGDQFRALLNEEAGEFRSRINAAFQSHPESIGAMGLARKSLAALN